MIKLIGVMVDSALEFLRSWVSSDGSHGIAVGKDGAWKHILADGVPGKEIKGPDTDADLYGVCGDNVGHYVTGGAGGIWYFDGVWKRCVIDGSAEYNKNILIHDIAYSPDENEWYAVDQRQGYYYSENGLTWRFMGKMDPKAKNLQTICYSKHYDCFVISRSNRLYKIDRNGNLKPFHRNAMALAAGHIIRAYDVTDELNTGMAMVTRTIEVTGPEFDTWKFTELPESVKKSGETFQPNLLSVTGVMPDGYRYACGESGVIGKFKISEGQVVWNNMTWIEQPGGTTLPAKGTMTGIMALKGNGGKYKLYVSGAGIKGHDGVLYSVVQFEI